MGNRRLHVVPPKAWIEVEVRDRDHRQDSKTHVGSGSGQPVTMHRT